MPRGRKPEGKQALSNAERQARYLARRMAQPAPAAARPRRPVDRRSRPQRWRDAVTELLSLQAVYADWLAALPESLLGSSTRPSMPLSSSILPTSLASNRPAAMAAISNAPERRMRQLCREEIESRCDPIRARLLDPGCGAMT
jgi:hypothetical protein